MLLAVRDQPELMAVRRTEKLRIPKVQTEKTLRDPTEVTRELKVWRERVSRELDVAAEIQRAALQQFARKAYPIFAQCEPAREVSGDFFDVVNLDPNKVLFCLGGVSGDAGCTAVVMAQSIDLFRAVARRNVPVEKILVQMNDCLTADFTRGMLVTLICGDLDLSTGRLRFVNAGHEPPLVYHVNDGFRAIEGRAPPLGNGQYRRRNPWWAEDIDVRESPLYLYSDGITEAPAGDGGKWGIEGLKNSLNLYRHLPLKERVCAVMQDAVGRSTERHDDMTLLAVDLTPWP